MARVGGQDTRIELTVRHGLHARGLRYRLGGCGLAGRPDIVLHRFRTVVFVHGCFWHGHNCPLYRLPKTRPEFWQAKVDANRARDVRVVRDLRQAGWRPLVIWECAIRGQKPAAVESILDQLETTIRGARSREAFRA